MRIKLALLSSLFLVMILANGCPRQQGTESPAPASTEQVSSHGEALAETSAVVDDQQTTGETSGESSSEQSSLSPADTSPYTVSDEDREKIQELLATVYAKLNWVAPRAEEAYIYALNEPEWLEKVPCWCGCARQGHKSNRECFITDEGELDPHGAGCKVCVDIALVTRDLLAEGLSIGEIRKLIDEQYSGWGVPSTPTPYYDS